MNAIAQTVADTIRRADDLARRQCASHRLAAGDRGEGSAEECSEQIAPGETHRLSSRAGEASKRRSAVEGSGSDGADLFLMRRIPRPSSVATRLRRLGMTREIQLLTTTSS